MIIGLRDCFVARARHLLYSNDYAGGELVTHAENCVDLVQFSKLGEALIAGKDVHCVLGAIMMGIPYEEFFKRYKKGDKVCKAYRQAAKAGNFGFGGGMGVPKFVITNRKSGDADTPCELGPVELSDGAGGTFRGYRGIRFCVLVAGRPRCGERMITEYKDRQYAPVCYECIGVSEQIRKGWFESWPENRPYFKVITDLTDNVGEIVERYSKRVRGGVTFTEAANGFFQARLADIAGRAQCRVSYEQDCVPESPLYGSRLILFAHDELFGECREEVGHEVSMRVNEIMVEEFRRGCPHHAAACKAEPTLMRRWYKQAAPVMRREGKLVAWDGQGRLEAWEP